MVQHRISIHHRNSAARLAVVTIPIKLDWVNEVRLIVTGTMKHHSML